jgi:hypothetical protein
MDINEEPCQSFEVGFEDIYRIQVRRKGAISSKPVAGPVSSLHAWRRDNTAKVARFTQGGLAPRGQRIVAAIVDILTL